MVLGTHPAKPYSRRIWVAPLPVYCTTTRKRYNRRTLKRHTRIAAVLAAICGWAVAVPAQQPSSAPYTVISRQARQPLPVRVVNGQEMFALDDLARLFNLTVREDTTAGALMVTAGAQTIVLSPQQPLASVA